METSNKLSKFRSRITEAKIIDKKFKDINPEYYLWSLELELAKEKKEKECKNVKT